MARYRGPRLKKCRSVGVVLPGLTTVATLVRAFPPGEHGTRRRSKPSDFKVRLVEKQKARWHFGILERQFQLYVKRASQLRGPSGANLVLLLQSRLDNIVWRLGFARTIPAARQLVVHGHITVNGKRVDIPSYRVRPGEVIAIADKSKDLLVVKTALIASEKIELPGWLEVDVTKLQGKVLSLPTREQIDCPVREQLIVELYSK